MVSQDLANGYSKLCQIDVETKLNPINKSIDEMLARLEEFQTMLSFVKQDRSESTEILSSLTEHKTDLDQLCARIDTVEKLVSHIKTNLDNLENTIEKTEEELGCNDNTITVTSIFSPLFKKKSKAKCTNEPVELFKTEDYFTTEQ